MTNPKTKLEKIDAAANWVEQMHLAHAVKDEKKFREAHQKASDLLFDVKLEMDTDDDEESE